MGLRCQEEMISGMSLSFSLKQGEVRLIVLDSRFYLNKSLDMEPEKVILMKGFTLQDAMSVIEVRVSFPCVPSSSYSRQDRRT